MGVIEGLALVAGCMFVLGVLSAARWLHKVSLLLNMCVGTVALCIIVGNSIDAYKEVETRSVLAQSNALIAYAVILLLVMLAALRIGKIVTKK